MMIDIQLRLSPFAAYGDGFVQLHAAPVTLDLSFREGTHTMRSEAFELGVLPGFGDRSLLGVLEFEYTYQDETRTMTVCGSTYRSARGLRLLTTPEGSDETCTHWAADAGFADDDLRSNVHWNADTAATPGVRATLQGFTRSAGDSLIHALQGVPGLTLRVRQRPPELPAEVYNELLAVYRAGRFHALHEPGQPLDAGDEVYTVDSVFGGIVTFQANEAFANVIGSTRDPKIAGKTWIRLWAEQFGFYPDICTSYQFDGFDCGSSLVGGHVIEGKTAKSMPIGSDAVYIFPICVQHNNDDSVYMEALEYFKGIWLRDYLGP